MGSLFIIFPGRSPRVTCFYGRGYAFLDILNAALKDKHGSGTICRLPAWQRDRWPRSKWDRVSSETCREPQFALRSFIRPGSTFCELWPVGGGLGRARNRAV